MSVSTLCAVLLGCAVVLASWRSLRHARTGGAGTGNRGWWLAALLLAQAASAVLLYLTLFPPAMQTGTGTLVVLSARATAAQLSTAPGRARVLALPEAPSHAGIERVPDLATALRRNPHARRLHVIGAGLPPRDQATAAAWPLRFDPAPLPRGLVELWSPRQVRSGARWTLSGRVEAVPGGRVELRDPGDALIARTALDGAGRFALEGSARIPGAARYSLRVVDAAGRAVEDVEVPLAIVAGAPLRVLVLAGGAGPELKYLRRWALDAGVQLRSGMTLSTGVRMTDAPPALDAAILRGLDLVVLDERAWKDLGDAGRAVLSRALREGLGVLLRLTGPLAAEEHAALRGLGFAIEDADIARTVRLRRARALAVPAPGSEPTGSAAQRSAAASEGVPALSRRALRIAASDATALLRDDNDAALASWRAEGQGRIALWWLTDSYRLVLAGHPDLHGTLWSAAFTTLARARGYAGPELRSVDLRAHERLVLCRVSADARVVDPTGAATPVLIDPPHDPSACAAYWPRMAGWHVLHTVAGEWSFHVRAAGQGPGLAAHAMREATSQLAAQPAPARTLRTAPGRASPWRYFLAWLGVSAALWWLERARPGSG